eukprot:CAMPEP_0178929784 /NCGR_PEP_ID=MMETSP0786-20121207/20831_1 /TAXON_ID=186022 /ORGANISM="Thalassionema frauenfeldii, Strain CCMP 1798" /LENGTH=521 /DNA_ID=CAMNT_0020606157 /DNA_START=254 /DNA_END=1819 /DNA_ORIENTATION=+
MTTHSLNQLLQEPSPVVDVSSVNGQTHLMPIGIVFSNTGTRISKNGRAFSIIQIGNLVTGPTVTVFLFGDAYSTSCKLATPGKVVGLLNPNIVPPREDGSTSGNTNSTSLSLSVRDRKQFIPIAVARDYGMCKGTTKFKRNDGSLVESRCKNHVDIRLGHYCKTHSKQANGKSVKTKSSTFIQKLRQEGSQKVGITSNITTKTPFLENKPASNTNPLLSKAPKNMVKGQLPTKGLALKTRPHDNYFKNPYQKTSSILNITKTSSKASVASSTLKRQSGNWLSLESKKAKKKPRNLNIDGCAFDGSVMIPKANKLFRGRPSNGAVTSSSTVETIMKNAVEKERKIREHQASLKVDINRGERLKVDSQHTDLLKSRSKELKATKPNNSENTFFASIGKVDLKSVREAKSRYAAEASAENYAKSRRAVNELLTKETQTLKSEASKKSSLKETGKVYREWYCAKCKRTTKIEPNMCKRQGHAVKVLRYIRETQTVTEKRLQLADKHASEGGLTLGAGIEWTGFRK